jgi:hypothetical protein
LPAVIHLGMVYNWGSRLFLTTDLIQGLQNRLGTSTIPELRFGLEARFAKKILPRLGLSLGGNRRTSSAIGLGFRAGAFHFDMAAGIWSGLFLADGKGLEFAIGMGIKR